VCGFFGCFFAHGITTGAGGFKRADNGGYRQAVDAPELANGLADRRRLTRHSTKRRRRRPATVDSPRRCAVRRRIITYQDSPGQYGPRPAPKAGWMRLRAQAQRRPAFRNSIGPIGGDTTRDRRAPQWAGKGGRDLGHEYLQRSPDHSPRPQDRERFIGPRSLLLRGKQASEVSRPVQSQLKTREDVTVSGRLPGGRFWGF